MLLSRCISLLPSLVLPHQESLYRKFTEICNTRIIRELSHDISCYLQPKTQRHARPCLVLLVPMALVAQKWRPRCHGQVGLFQSILVIAFCPRFLLILFSYLVSMLIVMCIWLLKKQAEFLQTTSMSTDWTACERTTLTGIKIERMSCSQCFTW